MTAWRKIERDVRDTLGEGAMWCARDGAFYWTDILAPALNRMTLASGAIERWAMPEPLGWVVSHAEGGLVGGFRSGIAKIGLDPIEVGPRKAVEAHLPGNRMNDGKTDATGAIWCGTMDMGESQASGSLYRISPQGELSMVDIGYLVPNGPAFSPCGRWLYHTDSGRRTIYRFALDDGHIRKDGVFTVFGEDDGYPDGMTTDAEGFLWVAHWDGGRISRFDPEGRRERSIALPAKRVTNIAFAGEAHDRMFVTSAATGLPPSEFDGALFEVDCGGITGNPTVPFPGIVG
ncbi:SMP-30/gluconolactonase/LRE family protein [Novosphingobium sp. KCTC 2891]|uniref:SMP-30/gluconolactonase/LRE family protein n=1 Tax=Novosphingobium sp. KCTC 2891 TaxID=2989730 RepID=UPI0022238EF9|nr:SMP-30/gluconolactonase/LRE family protein [Novosphingobium sp. KCTC 2891]MCW1381640.1 SMP-30/gluconolactonase/LRE family protein [Novosphingobium sp. KCTC 2891]